MIRPGFAALLLMTASPIHAQEDPLAPLTEPETEEPAPAEPEVSPAPLPAPAVIRPVIVPKDWRGVFSAIRDGDWASAQAGIGALPDDVLKPVARAEIYTARNSPRVELQPLLALLSEAPDLPQSGQVLRLALARGVRSATVS